MAPSRVRIPPSPPRRGGRAVECGGLENRYPSQGGSRVQIPPPPSPPLLQSVATVATLETCFAAIEQRQLSVGAKLRPERELARRLAVGRTTVVAALNLLRAESLLRLKPR